MVLPREDPDWQKALDAVNADPDNLDLWESLIELTERIQVAASKAVRGRYTRDSGSSSSSKKKKMEFPEVYAAIKATTRSTYDRFLERFVLLFGYWIKYAQLEEGFEVELGENENENGAEAEDDTTTANVDEGHGAQRVYERAVAAFPASVDLWTAYLEFMVTRYQAKYKSSAPAAPATLSKEVEVIRTLFERGAELVGRDFLSHPFWDKYLEFEELVVGGAGVEDRVVRILARVAQYPLHQYARYYEKLVAVMPAFSGPAVELIALAPIPGQGQGPQEEDGKDAAAHYARVFQRTQQGTTDRWAYESRISRSYFHVVELEAEQLQNWHAYLTWEEAQQSALSSDNNNDHDSGFEQTRSLYERALVPCALYDEVWLRYTRWLLRLAKSAGSSASGRREQIIEECRNVFRRASTVFVPISRPFIRYQFALFEESQGDLVAARDLYASMQKLNPGAEEPVSYRVDFERRAGGIEGAIAYIESLLKPAKTDSSSSDDSSAAAAAVSGNTSAISPNVKAYLIASQAKLYARLPKKDIPRARALFKNNANKCLSSSFFWVSYFEFEVSEALSLLRQLNSKSASSTKQDQEQDELSIQKTFQTHVQTYLDPLWSTALASKAHLPPSLIADLSRLYSDFLASSGSGPATPWAARAAFVDVDLEVNGPLVKRTRLLSKLADYGPASPAAALHRLRLENGHPGVEINPLQKQQQHHQQGAHVHVNQDGGEQAFSRYYAAQGGLSTY